MFDLFDFTPVEDDPFKRSAQPVSPVVSEFQKDQPDPNAGALAAAASIPTSSVPPVSPTGQSLIGRATRNIVRGIADLSSEGLTHYAGNLAHPLENRLVSAGLEAGNRMLGAVPNALQMFVGPMYGEGHVPVFNEAGAALPGGSGAEYAGAGINLASVLGGPGGEEALGAGWNPKASTYLNSLMKQKPALKPETAAAVQQMISKGPEFAKQLAAEQPGVPGVGFATLANAIHGAEEAQKTVMTAGPKADVTLAAKLGGKPPSVFMPGSVPKTPPPTLFTPGSVPKTPASTLFTPGSVPKGPLPPASVNGWSSKAVKYLDEQGFNPHFMDPEDVVAIENPGSADAPWLKALDIHAKETTQPGKMAPPPKVKPVTSTPLTVEQALGQALPVPGPTTATQAWAEEQLNKLLGGYVKPLEVPKMKPYDPTLKGKAALGHETAPGTSGMTTPFNPSGLPMDKASVMKRVQDMGFAPHGNNWMFWRGVHPHGPYSWDSAGVGYKDPITKNNEPGLFLAPDVSTSGFKGENVAKGYGGAANVHVIRSDNPLVMEWKNAAGGDVHYSSPAMQAAIKKAWAAGHDTLLLKNIKDVSNKGTVLHDQMVVRNPNQLRHPHAAFDPKYKDLPNLLAARGLGMELPPLVAQDQEMDSEQPNALGWSVTRGGEANAQ